MCAGESRNRDPASHKKGAARGAESVQVILLHCISFTGAFFPTLLSSIQMSPAALRDLALLGVGDRKRGHAQSLCNACNWKAAQSASRLALTSNGLIA
jgi:hypothetical protein